LSFPNRSTSFKFKIQSHSNFDWSKIDLPELQKFGKHMVVNISKRWTTFSIETSSDLEWISNEKFENLLGLEFNRISSLNFELGWNLEQGLLVAPSIQANSWVRIWSSY
jgi:hypothetical protein